MAIDAPALLAQYCPVVQYDSLESYYTDWAAVITDHPGNALKRVDGTVLATAADAGAGGPQLDLAFLRPDVYPSGELAQATDFIGETGGNYVSAAREMHTRPGYANKAHGRVASAQAHTWLQYWFFMYYDDPAFLGLGTHEGDIEMIQVRLTTNGEPDVVSYAQHRGGVRAPWTEIEQQGGAPVVYSARGTHASMMRHGTLLSDRSPLPDHNDAGGPRVRLDLIELDAVNTPWALWPGRWGGTKAGVPVLGEIGVQANSPAALPQHPAWRNPDAFYASCEDAKLPPVGQAHTTDLAPPPAPELIAQPAAGGARAVRVSYTIPHTTGSSPAEHLIVAVDSSGGELPPATSVLHGPDAHGELEADIPPGAGTLEVRGATVSAQGAVSPTARSAPAR